MGRRGALPTTVLLSCQFQSITDLRGCQVMRWDDVYGVLVVQSRPVEDIENAFQLERERRIARDFRRVYPALAEQIVEPD